MERADLEKDVRNIRLLDSMKCGDQRYDRCIDAFIVALIYSHAFQTGVFSGVEFKEQFGRYRGAIGAYRRCTAASRACMALAVRGGYKPALMLYKAMLGFKRICSHLR